MPADIGSRSDECAGSGLARTDEATAEKVIGEFSGGAREMLDQVFFERGNIVVSRSVIRFGHTTYATRAIGSARIDPPRSRAGLRIFGVIFTLIAVVLALDFGIELYKRRMLTFEDEEFGALLLALAVIGLAMLWISAYRGPCRLVLNGHMVVHVSKDEREIARIKRAIDYAVGLRALS